MIQPVKPDWTTGKILIAKRRGRGIVWAADCPENEYVISKVMVWLRNNSPFTSMLWLITVMEDEMKFKKQQN